MRSTEDIIARMREAQSEHASEAMRLDVEAARHRARANDLRISIEVLEGGGAHITPHHPIRGALPAGYEVKPV